MPDVPSSSESDDDFSGFDTAEEEEEQAGGARRTTTAAMYEKDSDEEELERLVLGSKGVFRENLFKFDGGDLLMGGEGDRALEGGDAGGLEEIDDADLFVFDTAGGDAAAAAAIAKSTTTTEKTPSGDGPAWEDSDDEKLAVSLAGVSRLRKLRISEAEDIVSGAEYSRRLRQQFLRMNPAPAWSKAAEGRPTKRRRRSSAASDSSMGSGSDSDGGEDVEAQPLEKFLRNVNKLAGYGNTHKSKLRPEVLDIQRTREIPDQHNAPVESLSFHPHYPVLLSASAASILYLHHIAPEAHPTPNPQLTSVQAKQVDVRRAEFLLPQGDRIFFGGRRKYFHHWDLPTGLVQKTTRIQGHRLEHKTMEKFRLSPCGRYLGIIASTKKGGGIVNILSTTSMQWVAAARLSSHHGVVDFAWWRTGDGLTILGQDGKVGEYSIESRKFLGIWIDEGSVGAVVIALGGFHGPPHLGEDKWVAVGSSSGITNIYDRTDLTEPGNTALDGSDLVFKERPTPKRVFEQLITPVTILAFSPDGQILAFGSRHKKDALKLAHLPTCTVFKNWPTSSTPLGRVTALSFGRQSDLLAVGNDGGKIRLWQIRS